MKKIRDARRRCRGSAYLRPPVLALASPRRTVEIIVQNMRRMLNGTLTLVSSLKTWSEGLFMGGISSMFYVFTRPEMKPEAFYRY